MMKPVPSRNAAESADRLNSVARKVESLSNSKAILITSGDSDDAEIGSAFAVLSPGFPLVEKT